MLRRKSIALGALAARRPFGMGGPFNYAGAGAVELTRWQARTGIASTLHDEMRLGRCYARACSRDR